MSDLSSDGLPRALPPRRTRSPASSASVPARASTRCRSARTAWSGHPARREADLWINGGFFAFKREIFDYLKDGEELVEEPFQRLIGLAQLTAYRHQGFWACMDTFKDKQAFDDMDARGEHPGRCGSRAMDGLSVSKPRVNVPGTPREGR